MSTAYPPYVTIVRRESDIPITKMHWRRHSMRLPGDGGPPRWEWSEPTQDMLRKCKLYSVAFVGPCKTCKNAHQAGCPDCQTNGIISEIIVVDRKAKPAPPRPLRGLGEYRRLARSYCALESQRRYRERNQK